MISLGVKHLHIGLSRRCSRDQGEEGGSRWDGVVGGGGGTMLSSLVACFLELYRVELPVPRATAVCTKRIRERRVRACVSHLIFFLCK